MYEAPELEQARDWLAEGHAVALATVVGTWGSSPRPLGAHLVIRDDGTFAGSVSGGCVEGAVITEAQAMLAGDTRPRLLDYGIDDETAWSVGLSCGGQLRVFLEPLA
jgi:xanthine/CO dehydrogenase XdhC/CoxF family maturation factor